MHIKFKIGDIINMIPSSTYYQVSGVREDERKKSYILQELRISGYDHSSNKMILKPTNIFLEKSYGSFYDIPWWWKADEEAYEVRGEEGK